jgi:hypothetical protein
MCVSTSVCVCVCVCLNESVCVNGCVKSPLWLGEGRTGKAAWPAFQCSNAKRQGKRDISYMPTFRI